MSTAPETAAKLGRAARLREELVTYALVAGYLYLCFGALALYKVALLRDMGIHFLPHGIAAGKALILGKFLLLGEAMGLGARLRGRGLLAVVARKTLLFFLLLVALSVAEEFLVGLVHGRSLAQTLADYEARSAFVMLVESFILLLVLVPLIAAREIGRSLGPGGLRRALYGEDAARID